MLYDLLFLVTEVLSELLRHALIGHEKSLHCAPQVVRVELHHVRQLNKRDVVLAIQEELDLTGVEQHRLEEGLVEHDVLQSLIASWGLPRLLLQYFLSETTADFVNWFAVFSDDGLRRAIHELWSDCVRHQLLQNLQDPLFEQIFDLSSILLPHGWLGEQVIERG